MLRMMIVSAALAIGATAVLAQANPIAQREELMKGVAAAPPAGNRMVKGEAPFELAKAKEILQTYAAAADRMHSYFPETAKTGGETTASPRIWESQADFRKRF